MFGVSQTIFHLECSSAKRVGNMTHPFLKRKNSIEKFERTVFPTSSISYPIIPEILMLCSAYRNDKDDFGTLDSPKIFQVYHSSKSSVIAVWNVTLTYGLHLYTLYLSHARLRHTHRKVYEMRRAGTFFVESAHMR